MKDNTIYLLYNTNASGITLHHGALAEPSTEKGKLAWEYIDMNQFTIMYSPEDDRKSTDIKILSKTRLKERPKTADVLFKEPKINVEGVLVRRTSSLSNIDDLFLARRGPLIKPLLSEAEIAQLQYLQEECKKLQYEYNRSSKPKEQETKNVILTTLNQYMQPGEENNKFDYLISENEKIFKEITSNTKRKLSAFEDKKSTEKSPDGQRAKNLLDKLVPQQLTTKPISKQKIKQTGKALGNPDYNTLTKGNDKEQFNKGIKNIVKKDKLTDKMSYIKTNSKKEKIISKHENKENDFTKRTKTPLDLKADSSTNRSLKNIKKSHSKQLHDGSNSKGNKPKKKFSKPESQTKTQNKQEATKEEIKHSGKINSLLTKKSLKSHKSGKSEKSEKGNSSKTSTVNFGQDKKINAKEGTSFKEEKKRRRSKDESKKIQHDEVESSQRKVEMSEETGSKKAAVKDGDKIKTLSSKQANPVQSAPFKSEKETNSSGFSHKKDEVESLQRKLEMSEETGSKKAAVKDGDKSKTLSSKQANPVQSAPLKSEKETNSSGFSHKKGKIKEEVASKKSANYSNVIQYMIQYVLSNPLFLKLGWTLLPTDRAVSRTVTFKTFPANPQTYCFRSREGRETKFYPSGKLAVMIEEDGTGKVYYQSGNTAMNITRSNMGMRLTLYSDQKMDPFIKDSFHAKVIGIFDSFGNGVVYNLQGKKILVFNQLQGIFNNPLRKLPYKWCWSAYEILEKQHIKELLSSIVREKPKPDVIQGKGKVNSISSGMKTSRVENKTEEELVYESILAELPPPTTRKSKMKSKSHTVFKSIILKINEEMTLRINDQDSVTVNFSSNSIFYRADLGVKVDPEVVERIDELKHDKLGDVPCMFDAVLHPSPSLLELTRQIDPSNG